MDYLTPHLRWEMNLSGVTTICNFPGLRCYEGEGCNADVKIYEVDREKKPDQLVNEKRSVVPQLNSSRTLPTTQRVNIEDKFHLIYN